MFIHIYKCKIDVVHFERITYSILSVVISYGTSVEIYK